MNPQTQPLNTNNPLNATQAGERQIFDIKRHPIGLITMYASAAFTLFILTVIIFVFAPALLPNNKDLIMKFGSIVLLIFTVLVLGFVWVSHIVYWGNRWILTSDSLTQVSQFGLFDRQSSQLSLANLEDVTAKTNGILAKMFNFGILKVETAGEHSKFTFLYCPSPEKYAQQILMAREQFEQGRHYEQEAPATYAPAPIAPPVS